jgi:hypothetical protein
MKKRVLFTMSLIAAAFQLSAQDAGSADSVQAGSLITSSGPRFVTRTPLYIISTDDRKLQLPASDSFSDWSQATRTIKQIDPAWINSVSVLKDQTDMYGYDGRHGVVLIELKKGTLKKLPAELRQKFD